MPILNKEARYTYEEYKNWNDEEDFEIINGVGHEIDRHPDIYHQTISGNLTLEIQSYLKGTSCKLFYSLDVVFSNEDVVRPDIVVVCDKNKLTELNIQGAPDLIIEIASPITLEKDTVIKLELYEKFGVKEYWIIDPVSLNITVYFNGKTEVYSIKDNYIPIEIFNKNLKLDIKDIFDL